MRRTGCDPAPSVPSPRIPWRTTGKTRCATVSSARSDSTPCPAGPPERSSAASHGSRPRAVRSPPSSGTRDERSTGRRSRTGCVDAVPAGAGSHSLPPDRSSRPARRPNPLRRLPRRVPWLPPRPCRARSPGLRRRARGRSSRPESPRLLRPQRSPGRQLRLSPFRPPPRWRSRGRPTVRRASRLPAPRSGRQAQRPIDRRRAPPPLVVRAPRRRRSPTHRPKVSMRRTPISPSSSPSPVSHRSQRSSTISVPRRTSSRRSPRKRRRPWPSVTGTPTPLSSLSAPSATSSSNSPAN